MIRYALLTLCLLSCAAPLQGADVPSKHALLIGVSKYHHSGMNRPEPLQFPEADAKSLGELLTEGGYQVDLLLGKAATKAAIRKKLAELAQVGESDGVVLVGLFGHGVEVETRGDEDTPVMEGCFCPFDTALQVLKDSKGNDLYGKDRQPITAPDPNTLLKLRDLMTALKVARAGHRVVLADCCRTVPNKARGRSFGAGFRAQDLPDNTSVLFGCSPNERAFEHEDWGHGAFTKCLLDELKGLYNGGTMETAQLAVALKRKVPLMVAAISGDRDTQTPKLFSTDSVDLQLAFDDVEYLQGTALLWGIGTKIDEMRGVELLKKAAERDHPLAMALLAKIYFQGQLVRQNKSEALRWATKAWPRLLKMAEGGQPRAQYLVAVCHDYGIGVDKDASVAATWYRKAADKHLAVAQYALGVSYQIGDGVTKDLAEALEWYRKAADQNYAVAQCKYGWMCAEGLGVDKDPFEAVRWYKKAAEQNDTVAQRRLAYAYRDAHGLEKDDAEALKWFRNAAALNDPVSQNELGVMYANGTGVEKNPAEAVRWYRKAADRSNAHAQTNLAIMYALGTGVEKDLEQTLALLLKASAQNDARANMFLGVMYESGEGVEKNVETAIKHYTKSSNLGFAAADYQLGMLYFKGESVKQDKELALKWLRKAYHHPNVTPDVKKISLAALNGYGWKDGESPQPQQQQQQVQQVNGMQGGEYYDDGDYGDYDE